jgi:hypothetical protein
VVRERQARDPGADDDDVAGALHAPRSWPSAAAGERGDAAPEGLSSTAMSGHPGYLEIEVDSWDHARDLSRRLWGFLFRGQEVADWELTTTLDRGPEYRRYERWRLAGLEREILDRFQRRAGPVLSDRPGPDEALEWSALLHQHGGPTRLLAFTHSFYIAAFFALERAPGGSRPAAIWAVNPQRLRGEAIKQLLGPWEELGSAPDSSPEELLDDDAALYRFLLDQPKKLRLAFRVEPRRVSEQLGAHQGAFVAPFDLEATFEDNLFGTFRVDAAATRQAERIVYRPSQAAELRFAEHALVKVVLPGTIHKLALHDLFGMNISAATLFPGLQGYARSLSYLLGGTEE